VTFWGLSPLTHAWPCHCLQLRELERELSGAYHKRMKLYPEYFRFTRSCLPVVFCYYGVNIGYDAGPNYFHVARVFVLVGSVYIHISRFLSRQGKKYTVFVLILIFDCALT